MASRTVLIAALAAVVTLAGCASSGPTADEQFPVTVTHQFGETEIAGPPHRIAALGASDAEILLALDIVPAGMAQPEAAVPRWTASRLADVRRRTGDRTVPTETQLQPSGPDVLTTPPPDLVLAVSSSFGQQDFDDDSAVAPVVGPPPGYGHDRYPLAGSDESWAPWQDATRLVGQAVGRPLAAERLVADVEGRFAAARARYPRLRDRTAACVHWGTGRSSASYAFPAGPRTPCSRFLAELGMRGVPGLDAPAGSMYAATVGPEAVAAAHPDLIVLDELSQARRDLIVRYHLPPGQRVLVLTDEEQGAVGSGNVLSLPVALETVPAHLSAALG